MLHWGQTASNLGLVSACCLHNSSIVERLPFDHRGSSPPSIVCAVMQQQPGILTGINQFELRYRENRQRSTTHLNCHTLVLGATLTPTLVGKLNPRLVHASALYSSRIRLNTSNSWDHRPADATRASRFSTGYRYSLINAIGMADRPDNGIQFPRTVCRLTWLNQVSSNINSAPDGRHRTAPPRIRAVF